MGILLLLVILGGAVLVFLPKRGSQFWRVAAAQPDAAYAWARTQAAWVIVDPESGTPLPPEPRTQFAGPFMLWVPHLGRTVRLYCVAAEIESSQQAFLRTQGIAPVPAPSAPWPSLLALTYPVVGALFLARQEPEASALSVAAYGVAQLGYLLVGAGLLAGSFLALGLRGRMRTIGAGLVAWLVGTVLASLAR